MDIETIYRLYFRDVYLFLQGLTHSEPLAEARPMGSSVCGKNLDAR